MGLYPGLTTVANQIAGTFMGGQVLIQVVVSTGPLTFSVSYASLL